MNEPSISTRVYIRWIPGIATEPTSTLVLTSATRRFVDIRIFKNPEDDTDLPNEVLIPTDGSTQPLTAPKRKLTIPGGPMSLLEWAFAGVSSSTLRLGNGDGDGDGDDGDDGKGQGPPVPHSTWTHEIDSNTDAPAADEGDMFAQPDGVHTLERGEMIDPTTGRLTRYEEKWADARVEVTEVDAAGGGGGGGGGGEGGKRWSVVLGLDDEAAGAKGVVVRVGQWCQGIIKVRGEVSVERWRWAVEETSDGSRKGDWKRVAKLGRLFLPCSFAFRPEMIAEGNTAQYGDYKWEVKEVFSW
ncbi:hypothetical protein MBLNU459_g2069t1 [Dothideomycetes sp. NU459]